MNESAVFWVLVAVVGVASYAGACAWWPWAPCGRCEGRGKLRSPSRRFHRDCPSCGGKGRKQRLGRRVLSAVRSSSR